VQNVIYFDTRILVYDAQSAEILTSDKKTLVVDNYSKWRIVDPLKFYRTVRTINGAQARLDDVIYSQMRVALGRHSLTEIVSSKRSQIMGLITKRSAELIGEYGIDVIDVRIKRTDLPPENARAIFGRMRAERERQAKQYRSEGQEESAKIKSQADRDKEVILAEANRQAQVIRGEGDAEATRIYAEALKQSPDFYSFQRSLEAYKNSFHGKTRIILTPDLPFLKHMR
jgi:membrane protease subunit HflC